MDLYTRTALACSRLTTKRYSTSFSLGIGMFDRKFHKPVYAIYGFVRFADEIVDTFHDQDQVSLLDRFKSDTFEAIEMKFSTNPILHSFQWVVNRYRIDHSLIHAFFHSMEMDLRQKTFTVSEYNEYIYGSAEVIGAMCLRIFYENDDERYREFLPAAMKLGSAFQKVNFLRDIKDDYESRGRIYFPGTDFDSFRTHRKREIEEDIREDLHVALEGTRRLPPGVRNGVYLALRYYRELLKKIEKTPAEAILQSRFRVSNRQKIVLLVKSWMRNKLGKFR
jgi:phytoene/squalene synthetase